MVHKAAPTIVRIQGAVLGLSAYAGRSPTGINEKKIISNDCTPSTD
jgi:hypothetical protein